MTEPLCPQCFRELGDQTSTDDLQVHQPSVGDYSVCLYCEALLVFREPLPAVRLMTLDDVDALDQQQALKLQGAIAMVKSFRLWQARQN